MTILGVDLSSNQASFNFTQAVQQGCRTAYIKLGGDNIQRYESGSYAGRVDQAHAAGWPVGSYWITGGHDPDAAGAFFAAHLHAFGPADYFVLDNEKLDDGNVYSDGEAAAWVHAVVAATGIAPSKVLHYGSKSFMAAQAWPHLLATGCSFLIADYNGTPLTGHVPATIPAARIVGHQYADDGNIGGAHPVDMNAFTDGFLSILRTTTSSTNATELGDDEMTATPDARIIRDYVTENTTGKTTTALIYPDGTAVRLNDKDDVTSACAAFQKTFSLPETIDRSNPANRTETDPRKVYGIQVTNKEWAAFFAAYPASKKIGF